MMLAGVAQVASLICASRAETIFTPAYDQNSQWSRGPYIEDACSWLWHDPLPDAASRGAAACKFLDASGTGSLSNAILCFEYCATQGAHVVSNSWGQYSTSPALQVRVQRQAAARHMHCRQALRTWARDGMLSSSCCHDSDII